MYFRGVALTSSICIVTECRVLGDALTYVLRLRAGLRRIVVCRAVVEIERAIGAIEPNVVLLDLQLGASEQALRCVQSGWPGARIIYFGCQHLSAEMQPCRRSGDRWIPREATCEQLLEALEASLRLPRNPVRIPAGRPFRTPRSAGNAVGLSPREREIAALIDQGMLNREIATRLGVSIATVKNHVHHILTKLHAHSRGQALARLRDHKRDEV